MFAIAGEKGGDALRAAEPFVSAEMVRKKLGVSAALTVAQSAASLPHIAAQGGEVECGCARGHG